jgi:LysR family cys regulon transcriptional activator
MNLHQFRFVQEAARRNLNLTETAKALYTSQPGISKAIIELEEELGVEIFARHGKRLRRITEPGQLVLKAVEVIMREVANLKRIGEEYSKQDAGTLSIATTHTQARYFLPERVAALRKRYPKVQVVLHQGTPAQVARMLQDDSAEIGLATESLADVDDLITLPCYERPHAHRCRIRARAAEARGGARGDRLRRDQDLRAPGHGRGHRGRDGGA